MLTTIRPKTLLLCGIAAAVIFVLINLLGTLWPGYDFLAHSISDLSAIGSPLFGMAYPLTILYGLLMTAFGVGIWMLGAGNRALRLTAALLLGYSLFGLAAAVFFPSRLGLSASDNLLYILPMALSIFSIVMAIGAGALAFRNWFRFYSLGTLALFAAMTLIGVLAVPQAAEPVSRAGLQERSMMVFNLLWVVLLARVLWRQKAHS